MDNKEDLLPYNRNYYLLGGCLTFIFTLIILSFVVQNLQRKEEEKPIFQSISVVQDQSNNITVNLSQYNQDSDQDGIPNFIEDEAGLEKYESEYLTCESKNQKCNSEVKSEKYYVSVVLDGSTSMGIIAEQNTSKIQKVKEELTDFILGNIPNNDFIITSLRSSGNSGQRGNIADSESCVSSLKLKGFDENIDEKYKRGNRKFLEYFDSYVANGKSPIIFTLEQAEKDFINPNAQNIIVLITDNQDDCNPSSLKNAFSGILSRGVVKKINTISILSSSFDEGVLKDATESNFGKFTTSLEINSSIKSMIRDTIIENWCLYKDQQKINQCVKESYEKAQNTLNSKVNSQTSQQEAGKIREINSIINLGVQNYTSSQIEEVVKLGRDTIDF
jgi:hypothetical protein